MVSRYSAYRRGSDTVPPDVIDRIMVGACAVVWLVLLGVSVAAAVALADLGRGFRKTAGNAHTTWVLYAVIIVSALIIAITAVGLLRVIFHLRAIRKTLVATTGGVQAVASLTSTVPARLTSVNANLKPVRDFCEAV